MKVTVVGIGQPHAGDDGVGAAVVEALQARPLPSEVVLQKVSDPSVIVDLIHPREPLVIVDAVLGSPAGEVLSLDAEDIARRAPLRLSSHGMGVAEAIALARALDERTREAPIRIVAVTIARPPRYQHGLSPEAAAAVPTAVERVMALVEEYRA